MELFGNPTFKTANRVLLGQRVMMTSGGGIVPASDTEAGIGTAYMDATGTDISVRLFADPGIHLMIFAGGAIQPGTAVFAAGDGKVSTSGSVRIGYVVSTPSDLSKDGDEIPIVVSLSTANGSGGTGTTDHSQLTNRDLADQHPVSAISGLEDTLGTLQSDLDTMAGSLDQASAAITELSLELDSSLPLKADLVEGKVPKEQLPEHIVYELGYYLTLNALLAAHPDATPGDYAYVYNAATSQYVKYVWDTTAQPPAWKATESSAAGVQQIENYAGAIFTDSVKIDKTFINLANVDNTADVAKPISNATQIQLDLKANLASPALTGNPTATTQTAGNNSTRIATTAFVTTALANKTTITGNAGTATKLATARTISLSGAITGSASFDGSANATIATTSSTLATTAALNAALARIAALETALNSSNIIWSTEDLYGSDSNVRSGGWFDLAALSLKTFAMPSTVDLSKHVALIVIRIKTAHAGYAVGDIFQPVFTNYFNATSTEYQIGIGVIQRGTTLYVRSGQSDYMRFVTPTAVGTGLENATVRGNCEFKIVVTK